MSVTLSPIEVLSHQIRRTRDILNVLRSTPVIDVTIAGEDKWLRNIYAVCFEYANERNGFIKEDMIRFYQSKMEVLLAEYEELKRDTK